MNYVDLNKNDPFRSIKYYPEEHVFDHDLSITSIGRNYEITRLRDILPIEPFLNLPIDITDELIQGMQIGQKQRIELEEDDQRRKEIERQKALQSAQNINNLHNTNGEG